MLKIIKTYPISAAALRTCLFPLSQWERSRPTIILDRHAKIITKATKDNKLSKSEVSCYTNFGETLKLGPYDKHM